MHKWLLNLKLSGILFAVRTSSIFFEKKIKIYNILRVKIFFIYKTIHFYVIINLLLHILNRYLIKRNRHAVNLLKFIKSSYFLWLYVTIFWFQPNLLFSPLNSVVSVLNFHINLIFTLFYFKKNHDIVNLLTLRLLNQ